MTEEEFEEIVARDAEYVDPLPSLRIAAHHMNWPAVNDRRALIQHVRGLQRECDRLKADARRYQWLREEAYYINGNHRDGQCAYDQQKEPVAMWIKAPNGTKDDQVDAAIDAALSNEQAST